jgi:hypothetical protein
VFICLLQRLGWKELEILFSVQQVKWTSFLRWVLWWYFVYLSRIIIVEHQSHSVKVYSSSWCRCSHNHETYTASDRRMSVNDNGKIYGKYWSLPIFKILSQHSPQSTYKFRKTWEWISLKLLINSRISQIWSRIGNHSRGDIRCVIRYLMKWLWWYLLAEVHLIYMMWK